MIALICKCSHPELRHERGEGVCWSLACGCQRMRPRVDTCAPCLGTGMAVSEDGMRTWYCTDCHGGGRAA